MKIHNIIDNISKAGSRDEFVELLDKNIAAIETTFYKSDYNTINNVKFELEDLIYDLEDRTLIKINDDSANVRAFLIILADFYDRFCLRGAISIIYKYIPACSVKKRLQASSSYLGFNNVELYNDEFNNIVQLLNEAFIDNDMGYRARISIMNYFLAAKKILQDNYSDQLEQLAKKFNSKQDKYEILNHSAIQELINNGVIAEVDALKDETEKLQKEIFDANTLVIEKQVTKAPKIKSIVKEEGDYSLAYNKSSRKNFTTIQNLAKKFGRRSDINHYQLQRGTAIIEEEVLLYQYILSYGEMHKHKLKESIEIMPWAELSNSTINCIDWGCGQALASVMLHDFLSENNYKIKIDNLLLIEPSILALKRGLLHVESMPLIDNVMPINKTIESINSEDINIELRNLTVHLFSNILDVPQFDIHTLCEKIRTNIGSAHWQNLFICISPNIDDLRNQRIESFYKWWTENYTTSLISARESDIGKWTRMERIFWAHC